jgi:hypothetical protein
VRSTALALVLAAALLSVSGAAAHAASPELGATIQSRVYIDQGGTLAVWNRSTVEARFDFVPATGWLVTPAYLVLAPDQQAAVTVSGEGADAAEIVVRVTATAPPPPGASTSVLEFGSRVYLTTPLTPGLLWPWLLAGAVLLLAARRVVLRRLRA